MALCFLAASILPAQETTGSINGLVLDPSNAAVPAAEVQLRETQTGLRRTVRTTGAGVFQAPLLPPGIYDLEINHPGFAAFRALASPSASPNASPSIAS